MAILIAFYSRAGENYFDVRTVKSPSETPKRRL